jgi:hypothetical protein
MRGADFGMSGKPSGHRVALASARSVMDRLELFGCLARKDAKDAKVDPQQFETADLTDLKDWEFRSTKPPEIFNH